ncbi:hypothetical protein IV203_038212 [Nitzschia inconspicua]|uniref:Uncharacterized protein n=1 Tax=Nitzschia inconspicua TaxID=303405 RepID=A0A9K3Q1P4_9STRA|nr:hypothetical protein IV203_038212 [Nitzschia inconspicua]
MEDVARSSFEQGDSIPPRDPLLKNSAQKELFDLLCNRACELSWEKSNREVRQFLNVDMSKKQQKLVNPSCRHVLMGFKCYDLREGGVKQKVAQRRLNMVEGNVNSYAPCLNNQKRLSAMREMDQLIAAIAQVTADQETDKEEGSGCCQGQREEEEAG